MEIYGFTEEGIQVLCHQEVIDPAHIKSMLKMGMSIAEIMDKMGRIMLFKLSHLVDFEHCPHITWAGNTSFMRSSN